MAAGLDFTLALDGNGALWGWGRNDVAQLGFQSQLPDGEKGKLAGKTLTFQRSPHLHLTQYPEHNMTARAVLSSFTQHFDVSPCV